MKQKKSQENQTLNFFEKSNKGQTNNKIKVRSQYLLLT